MKQKFSFSSMLLILVLAGIFTVSCDATDFEQPSFAFTAEANPQLTRDAVGVFSGRSIQVSVPPGTDLTTLVATHNYLVGSPTVNDEPQLNGLTPNDFTNPVIYKIDFGGTSTTDFTVTVNESSAQ